METYSENNHQCHNIVREQNGALKTASITCDSAEGKKALLVTVQKQTNLQNQCFVKYRQRQRRRNTRAELKISFSIGDKYQVSLET